MTAGGKPTGSTWRTFAPPHPHPLPVGSCAWTGPLVGAGTAETVGGLTGRAIAGADAGALATGAWPGVRYVGSGTHSQRPVSLWKTAWEPGGHTGWGPMGSTGAAAGPGTGRR